MKLVIGIPTGGTVKTKTLFSIVQLVKRMPTVNILTKETSVIHQNRINIAKEAIKGGCTHLLFIDSDMVFETDAIQALIKRNRDIIGARYHQRKFPLTAVLTIQDRQGNTVINEMPDGTFECASVGTGFMLIKLSIFKHIPQPWFFFEQDDEGNMIVGEDMWFCYKAREAGFKVYYDPTIKVGHVGDHIY